MPGCSLKEVFPQFARSVNLEPKLQPGVKRYGVETLDITNNIPPGEKTLFNTPIKSRKVIENFEGSQPEPDYLNNIGKFNPVIPTNIEKMLETSVGDMEVDPFGEVEYPTDIGYKFDSIPYERIKERTNERINETNIGHVNDKLIIHIKHCEGCRGKLKEISGGNVIIRESSNSMEQMTEFMTFIGIGIFIIFVLDIIKKRK